MSKFTFLEQEQYFDGKIYIIEKRETKAAITDFSILLGGYVANDCHIDGDDSLAGRIGYYWTKSDMYKGYLQRDSKEEERGAEK